MSFKILQDVRNWFSEAYHFFDTYGKMKNTNHELFLNFRHVKQKQMSNITLLSQPKAGIKHKTKQLAAQCANSKLTSLPLIDLENYVHHIVACGITISES